MIYDLLAPFYDKFNGDINYSEWADFIEKIIERHYGVGKPDLVLDLGCGTGSMTIELARRGYDMTGIDYSPEMLDIARERTNDLGLSDKMLWLCQDMREFELYGTVDAAVCCLDGINHLTSNKDLDKTLSLVHNYLIPDGLFIFDINGKYKFENIYGDESYVMESSDAMCVWQNYYNKNTKCCDFYITLFKESRDGRYERYDEIQRERMYTLRMIKSALSRNSLEFIGAYSNFEFDAGSDDSERLYIVARCKKEN
ncbi:MAG: class I SAM-dependent methyltransferase [Clostridia bacterium]|nr:class I SAM-dependent methyltransferase [Clostridia bacterium]